MLLENGGIKILLAQRETAKTGSFCSAVFLIIYTLTQGKAVCFKLIDVLYGFNNCI